MTWHIQVEKHKPEVLKIKQTYITSILEKKVTNEGAERECTMGRGLALHGADLGLKHGTSYGHCSLLELKP